MNRTRSENPVVDGAACIPDAMAYTSLSRSTLYKLMDARELPYLKIGRARRILWADLRQLLERSRVNT
jgi:excisionase family DNA binding protein